MQIFKLFIKVAKQNLVPSIIFLVIFLGFSIISAKSISNIPESSLSAHVPITVFDKDHSSLSNAFLMYMKKQSEIIVLEEDDEIINDALFFNKVAYVITIPEGFEKSLKGNNPLHLSTLSAPNSTNSYFMDTLVNNYFATITMYMKSMPNKTIPSLITMVEKDLSLDTPVSFSKKQDHSMTTLTFFFNFASYSLIPIAFYLFGTFIMVLVRPEIKKRMISSSMTQKSVNIQILLSSLCISFFLWISFVLVSIALCDDKLFTTVGLYISINFFILILVIVSLSYLIGLVAKDNNIQNLIANVIALGFSFISGAFVPQELLDSNVKFIASFTPTFWYVKTNDTLAGMTTFNQETLTPVFTAYGIQLAFCAAILSVAFTVSSLKRKTS